MNIPIEDLLALIFNTGLELESATEVVYQILKVEPDVNSNFKVEKRIPNNEAQRERHDKSLEVQLRIIDVQHYLKMKDNPVVREKVDSLLRGQFEHVLHHLIEKLVKNYYEWQMLRGKKNTDAGL